MGLGEAALLARSASPTGPKRRYRSDAGESNLRFLRPSAFRGWSARGASVLDRHDNEAVLLLDVRVHENEPAPRAEEEPKPLPPAAELGTEKRELLQRAQRPPHAFVRIGGKAVGVDESREIRDCGLAQLNARHLEVVERNRAPGPRLLQAHLGALERTVDAVEQLGDVPRIGIGLVERVREKRAGERPFLDVRAPREPSQLRGVLAVERDVQPVNRSHIGSLHETAQIV
jgi:hypothetical protein